MQIKLDLRADFDGALVTQLLGRLDGSLQSTHRLKLAEAAHFPHTKYCDVQ